MIQMGDVFHAIQLSFYFLLLFGLAESLHKFLKLSAEITRKIVHIGGGLVCLQLPTMFENAEFILILVFGFGGFLWLSRKFGFLPSVNNIQRQSNGGVLFPLAIGIAYMGYYVNGQLVFFYIPLLILTICDPLAYFCGKTFPFLPYTIFNNSKTVSGSLAFLLSAFAVTYWVFNYLNIVSNNNWLVSWTTAVATTLVEALSNKGYDNVLIPFSAVVILSIFYSFT